MLAHAPRISDSFLRYEHHRNRLLFVFSRAAKATSLSSSEPRRAPLSTTCPGCQCPLPSPQPASISGLPERWRRHTQSQHSTCAQGVLKLVSSFFQSADGHANVAAPPLSLHLFAHIFTNPHCPRASLPSPVPHPSPRTCSEPGSPLCSGSHSPKLAAFSRAPSRSFVSRSGALSLGQWDSFHSFYQVCPPETAQDLNSAF